MVRPGVATSNRPDGRLFARRWRRLARSYFDAADLADSSSSAPTRWSMSSWGTGRDESIVATIVGRVTGRGSRRFRDPHLLPQRTIASPSVAGKLLLDHWDRRPLTKMPADRADRPPAVPTCGWNTQDCGDSAVAAALVGFTNNSHPDRPPPPGPVNAPGQYFARAPTRTCAHAPRAAALSRWSKARPLRTSRPTVLRACPAGRALLRRVHFHTTANDPSALGKQRRSSLHLRRRAV